MTYLHTDHLNTPRIGTDGNEVVVWRWDSDAFGQTAPDTDPDSDGVQTVVNLRFPGQIQDGEATFYYNYFRDYDPSLGRYLTSDPIGLASGINTYAYVGGNPIGFADPLGLYTAVVINGTTPGNPFGHTAIATSGSGVYSFGNSTKLGSSLTDYLEREALKRNTNVIVIDTSQQQENAINDYLSGKRDDLPPWLFGIIPDPTDTCSTRTSEALNSAGLIDPFITIGPSFPTDVAAQAAFWSRQTGGATYVIPKGGTVPPELKIFNPK
ncbi:hypothetical protein OQJ59_16580 [Microbulbifer thermotolerans]|uniref:RHS repeat-associated core domain-containing protein n=1 Tax=Microbulbifer thermotolerans TaxID=252514 RepID=UPI00224B8811|nr:RHS repeat-associated core domain-containing protein [Microbulbifer thermotolerans]MCX2843226.1 hypothetical protein [Microbulbifer thermotolerans]